MKKLLICVMLFMFCGCSHKEITKKTETEIIDHGYTEIISVELTEKNKEIISIKIDQTTNGRTATKKQLGADYGMIEASLIQKEWFEQCQYLEDYIVKNGLEAVNLNEQGYATDGSDLAAGCTIYLGDIIQAVAKTVAAEQK